MNKTAVIGFGPFGKVKNNPSAKLVKELARMKPDVESFVLPSRFDEATQGISKIIELNPAKLVMFGYSSKAKGFKIERYGKNKKGLKDSPDFYETDFDLNSLVKKLLSANLPAYISEDAGSFVCNHTYFVALDKIVNRNLKTKCLFVHIPPKGKYLTDTQLIKGALMIIES